MWSSSRLLTLALAAVLAAAAAAAADTQLVIYTYNYILQTTDPTYDFVSIFADTVGVDPSVISVQVHTTGSPPPFLQARVVL